MLFRVKLILTILLLQLSARLTSQQSLTSCEVCERRPTSCRRLAGLYTVTVLSKGTYNPVVEIPAQACSINITELAPSQNYLAVRTDSGDNVVNGYWSVGSTGSFAGVGTQFSYNRGARNCPGECIYAPGPTDRQITVQLLYYNKNPGIAYEFVLLNDVPFKPFDSAAPQVEARTRTHHHRETHPRRHHSPFPRQEPDTSEADTYEASAQGTVTSDLEEPSRQYGTHRQTAFTGGRSDPKDPRQQPDYNGTSYGSHTLDGRGQSYTHQYTRDTEDPHATYTSATDMRRRPSLDQRPAIRRQQAPSWLQQAPTNLYESYDADASRGYQTLASSSRGGLVDKTYSRTVDTDANRLRTFERPVVEQRPTLTIGTGAGGNEYEWAISGFTACTLTCGGGIQETKVVCVLTSAGTQVVVTEDNCQNAVKPRVQRVTCNNEPCPPGWVTDEWSDCSVTCGSGTQNRRIECKQRFSVTLEISVSASQCDQTEKPAVAQQCDTNPCAQWRHGGWSECSADCGGGERRRKVECVDGTGVQIPESYCPSAKPDDTETCNSQPCNTQWWTTNWSGQCSADCGSGLTTRTVMCTDRSGRPVAESACDASKRPHDRERCESSAGCGTMWFAGSWSQCSDNCGQGVKTRQVVCMQRADGRGAANVVGDDQCRADDKPSPEEACFSTACGAQYYMTGWSQCSVTCGEGVRTREVRCLDENQRQSWSCDRSHAPVEREACRQPPCRQEAPREIEIPVQTSSSEGNCVNTFWNCRLVVQARLCKIPFYTGVCCAACRRSKNNYHRRNTKTP